MNQLLYGKNIIKSFGAGDEKRNVLNGVSVEIENGEFVSVMGPSGSGKSTLLYALSGMGGIDRGEIIFENQNLSALSDDALSDLRRNRMGFVFQQPTLIKNLSILDNIILPQARDHRRNIEALVQKARQLMKQMGIEDLEQRDITQASGGQLQRAGICRALMNNPKILFCDEPTGALNSKTARDVMDLFSRINENGTAILLITHDASMASRAGRVLFLCDRKILSEERLGKFAETDSGRRTGRILEKMHTAGI